jgi:hypothetical protein
MQKYFFVLFFMIGNILFGQNILNDIVHNGDINALNDRITIFQLQNFSRNDLRILRNTIYAKYGYSFNSIDLKNHFSKFEWYSELNANVDNFLTDIDKENIGLIQRVERNYPENNISNNNIIGRWHYFGAVAGNWPNSIADLSREDMVIFLPNGIYIYFPRQRPKPSQ